MNYMSLVIATRYSEGILLASDSFVFDNDGDVPSKAMDFEKLHVHHNLGMAMAYVGSTWVFHSFIGWLKSHSFSDDIIYDMSEKWKELNGEWKDNREIALADADQKTLRPVSDSLLFIACQEDLKTIHVIDSKGEHRTTNTFLVSGSGSDIVKNYCDAKGKVFSVDDGFDESMKLMQETFYAASHDLYVIGCPCFCIVRNDMIVDISKYCDTAWKKCVQMYWESTGKHIDGILKNQ